MGKEESAPRRGGKKGLKGGRNAPDLHKQELRRKRGKTSDKG